jgi:hypothetical protein
MSCLSLQDLVERYARFSLLITANQPFGERGKVFLDQAMTLAARRALGERRPRVPIQTGRATIGQLAGSFRRSCATDPAI